MRSESKPLVAFVLAAVVAAIVLVFVIGDSLRTVPDAPQTAETPAATSQEQAASEQASTGEATSQSSETASADSSATTSEQAADSTAEQDTASGSETAAGEEKPVAPSFDIVRVEEDGAAVIAGRAAPGSEIMLMLNGKTIGSAVANDRGEWVVTPNAPLPKGDHNLMIMSKTPDGVMAQSEQMVAVSVPEAGDEQPLIVLSQPAQPSQVLQKPAPAAEPEPKTETEVAAVEPAQTEEAAAEPSSDGTEKTAEAASEEQSQPASQEQGQAESETTQTATAETDSQAGTASSETQTSEQAAASDEQDSTQTAAVEATEQAPATPAVPLNMSAIDYNDAGDIVFSGKAGPGETVRVYVDNAHIGDAIADQAGNWVFYGRENIKPGVHALRIDQIDANGQVAQRRELPFERAEPAKVAELHQSQSEEVATPAPAAASEEAGQDEQTRQVQPAGEDEQAGQSAESTETAAADTAAQPAAQSEETASAATPKVGRVIIQPGNNLWNISRVIYGRGIEYSVIYEANKEQIRNPHRIYPGQIFTTPGVVPPSEIDPKRREPLEQDDAPAENG